MENFWILKHKLKIFLLCLADLGVKVKACKWLAPMDKDYDIGRVDSNVPINIVEEQINVSLTLNFNMAFSLGRGSN